MSADEPANKRVRASSGSDPLDNKMSNATTEPAGSATPAAATSTIASLVERGLALLRQPGGAEEAVRILLLAAAAAADPNSGSASTAPDPEAATAAATLAECYTRGWGVRIDAKQAKEWMERAAKLGDLYAQGKCLPADARDAATAMFREAATRGNPAAMYALGEALQTAKELEEAITWYRRAAELGHAAAMDELGLNYESGVGVGKDRAMAATWYERAAALGDGYAMWDLGSLNDSATSDEAQAWFRRAADKNCDDIASCVYGFCADELKKASRDWCHPVSHEQFGLREPQTLEWLEALTWEWLRRAAEAGDAKLMHTLGVRCAYGEGGVPVNEAEAVTWFQRAADLGNVDAMASLAACYRNGRGVARDHTRALHWFRAAADAGDTASMVSLGQCFFRGLGGVERDLTAAVAWYRKAAELGNGPACVALGRCYLGGWGVVAAPSTGIAWLRKADGRDTYADGFLMLHGLNTWNQMSTDSALTNFHAAAISASDPAAMVGLGWCIQADRSNRDGDDHSKAWGRAVYWYQCAADLDDPEALVRLGECYELGRGVPCDPAAANRWYQKAAAFGDIVARHKLAAGEAATTTTTTTTTTTAAAAENSTGADGPQDGWAPIETPTLPVTFGVDHAFAKAERALSKAVNSSKYSIADEYRTAAELGHPTAMVWLGRAYAKGTGSLPQNWTLAAAWLRRAANLDNSEAMRLLGWYLRHPGPDRSVDIAQALRWLHRAADRGSGTAMTGLGWMYQQGDGVEQDGAAAVAWYTRAAALDDGLEAYVNLGICYQYGVAGVPVDLASARRWFEQAIADGYEGGVPSAKKLELGLAPHTLPDVGGALAVYRKLADSAKPDPDALFCLGQLYEHGVPGMLNVDASQAITFYRRAVEAGFLYARVLLARLEGGGERRDGKHEA